MVCGTYTHTYDDQGYFDYPVNTYTLFLEEIWYPKDSYSVQCPGNVFHLVKYLDIG